MEHIIESWLLPRTETVPIRLVFVVLSKVSSHFSSCSRLRKKEVNVSSILLDWTKKLNLNVNVSQEQSRITKVRKYNSRFTVFRTSCCCEYCTWPWNFHKLVFIHQFRCACLQSELNRDWCQMVVLLWHSEWPRRVLRWIFKAELEGETFV